MSISEDALREEHKRLKSEIRAIEDFLRFRGIEIGDMEEKPRLLIRLRNFIEELPAMGKKADMACSLVDEINKSLKATPPNMKPYSEILCAMAKE